ncbi:TSUP family transporter [Pseudonocardia sp. GCM10023141]|uniref:TSUP family transporter n=1 Tax=Pseudonocardia sp. GCM10023141 TaxID=3252653 RepID=UPI00360BC7CA
MLTVPVLVYLLGRSAQGATTGSLVIVGVTAVVGTAVRAVAGDVRWRVGLAFGAAGIPAAWLGSLANRHVP